MQLLLKHNLTKKRAEYKLLIMYYKACNIVLKAKLMMTGTEGNDIRTSHVPQTPDDIRQAYSWYEHFERRTSDR